MSALTAADLELLRRPLYGFFTAAGGPDPAQPRPVWFEAADDGTVEIFTEAGAVKVRRLRRDPRASLVVTAPAGEPEHWVSVAGAVTITPDGAADLARRLGARYYDLTDPKLADSLEAMAAGDLLRVIIAPDKVSRFAI